MREEAEGGRTDVGQTIPWCPREPALMAVNITEGAACWPATRANRTNRQETSSIIPASQRMKCIPVRTFPAVDFCHRASWLVVQQMVDLVKHSFWQTPFWYKYNDRSSVSVKGELFYTALRNWGGKCLESHTSKESSDVKVENQILL